MATSGTWESNYQKLAAFQKEHGHCNVPRKNEHRMLAKWVSRQRKSRIAPEQKDRLDKIGFCWETKQQKDDKAWNERWQQLARYKRKHGDCRVPLSYPENPALGTWVANQRKLYHQGKLRKDRLSQLESLKFKWSLVGKPSKEKGGPRDNEKYDAQWKAMFQKLEKYKAKYGNCNVPYCYPEDPSLAMWVSTQRRAYRQKTWLGTGQEMPQDRKDLLESIGFSWKIDPTNQKSNLKDTLKSRRDGVASPSDDERKKVKKARTDPTSVKGQGKRTRK